MFWIFCVYLLPLLLFCSLLTCLVVLLQEFLYFGFCLSLSCPLRRWQLTMDGCPFWVWFRLSFLPVLLCLEEVFLSTVASCQLSKPKTLWWNLMVFYRLLSINPSIHFPPFFWDQVAGATVQLKGTPRPWPDVRAALIDSCGYGGAAALLWASHPISKGAFSHPWPL